MPINLSDFHFLRPEILWLLIPIALLVFHMNTRAKRTSAWQNVISPHLLEFLFVSGNRKKSRLPIWISALLASLLVIASSGPTYRQKAVPVFETENAQVILMDLSLSMDATDIKPSRLDRAKFKLLDILEHTKEGTAALVVYAGDAFVISPLTSDANTIANMVPTLSTGIMPVLGSRPDVGIKKAIELLKNAKHNRGQIIWLTDGVDEYHTDGIIEAVNASGYQLSILAIGTEQGAPIPLANGNGFLKDSSGAIVVPKLDTATLSDISKATQAGYVKMTADDSDIEYLKKHLEWRAEQNEESNDEQKISKWIDDGYWLIWIALLLCLIKIIRQPSGSLASFLVITLFGVSSVAFSPSLVAQEAPTADSTTESAETEDSEPLPPEDSSWKADLKQGWTDLWSTKDQQGLSAYRDGNYGRAANLFENKKWQAASQFRKGDFNQAAHNFAQGEDIRSQYNHATSLAKSEQLQPALDAYNKLLEQQPDHQDALHNKKIVEELLKQQQEKEQQQDQNSEQDKQDQQQQQDSQSEQQQQQENQQQSEEEQQAEQQQQESQEQQQQAEQKQQEMELSEDERDKSEKDQALEHWLEKIPDDPGGLLRRKMYREYQRRGRKQKEEKLW